MTGGNWKDLFKAAAEGNEELVGYHLRMGVDPNYQHPEYFSAPLFEAIRFGQTKVVALLLKSGALPNVREDYSGILPIELAMQNGHHEMVDLLLPLLSETEQAICRQVLITGGNRGIGKAIAHNVLNEGHRVLITVRSQETGMEAVKELQEATGNQKINFVVGDLSSVSGVIKLAATISVTFPGINVLVNNAGIWPTEKIINEDGLEMGFMVNYLAPYLLSQKLLPLLQKNRPSRIVLVNAGLYLLGRATTDKTPTGLDFHPIRTYASTKQCGVYFLQWFSEQIEGAGVTINAVHPGIINTGLGDSKRLLSRMVKWIKRFWKKAEYGGIAPSFLALSPELEGKNGLFFNETKTTEIPEKFRSKAEIKDWKIWTEVFLSK